MHVYLFFFGVDQDTCGPRYFLFTVDEREHTWITWLEFSLWICLRSSYYEKKLKKYQMVQSSVHSKKPQSTGSKTPSGSCTVQ